VGACEQFEDGNTINRVARSDGDLCCVRGSLRGALVNAFEVGGTESKSWKGTDDAPPIVRFSFERRDEEGCSSIASSMSHETFVQPPRAATAIPRRSSKGETVAPIHIPAPAFFRRAKRQNEILLTVA
jgi:hypothetical protein